MILGRNSLVRINLGLVAVAIAVVVVVLQEDHLEFDCRLVPTIQLVVGLEVDKVVVLNLMELELVVLDHIKIVVLNLMELVVVLHMLMLVLPHIWMLVVLNHLDLELVVLDLLCHHLFSLQIWAYILPLSPQQLPLLEYRDFGD